MKYFGDSIDYNEAVHINDIYMDGMKKKVIAREGTLDVIEYLYDKKYTLFIERDNINLITRRQFIKSWIIR